jgi:hypothetical protein
MATGILKLEYHYRKVVAMNRNKKLLRNMVLIVLISLLFMNRTGLYINPITAHESSERNLHYGPSEIVHVEDFDGGKYLLCKYDKWISCNVIERRLFILWSHGQSPFGRENDLTKKMDYSWGNRENNSFFWGIINDKSITKVELELKDGSKLTTTEFYDDLFLLTWKMVTREIYGFKKISAYNSVGELVFEEEY